MNDDLQEEGQEVELSPEVPSNIEELPEGGAMIEVSETVTVDSSEFSSNLAEDLPDSVLNSIAQELLELLELDIESGKKYDELYEEGLKLSGLDREASVGADFDGASRAVHPILAEAAVDFAARAIKELFPSNGPVKTQIIGKVNEDKLEKAERKKTYLNWQLTKKIKEYRRELEQLLTQNSLAGSQFSKVYWDDCDKRIHFEYVPGDQIILPFSATSFAVAKRKAQILEKTRQDLEQQMKEGIYREIPLKSSSLSVDQTDSKKLAQRIEGKEDTGYNEDGVRKLYEIYVWVGIEEDTVAKGELAPYIITIDDYTQKIIGLYRNWKESDESREELVHVVEWPFIPWRGSRTLGLVSFIGSLAIAATGALNALLDSAHVNTIPTAVALKGSKVTGSTLQIEPTTVAQVEGPAGVDDIRKLMMSMPYNPPSPVMFQLLGWLTDAAKGVIATASEKIADASNTGPVGTTYALIEQGAQIFSSIHARLHTAQAEVLDIICRLNSEHLQDREVVKELGELVVSRQDFEGPMDICPVSDPNIFSETQRWAQLQEAFKLSQDPRVKYDIYKLHERALSLLRFPQIEEVLPPQQEPKQTNPVAENVNATKGMPLFVFPEEDHIAHIKVHLNFITDQSFQLIATPAIGSLFGHIQQHLVNLYSVISTGLASEAIGGDVLEFLVDPKLAGKVDGLLAEAMPHVHEIYAQQVEPFKQQLLQVAQMLQQQAQANQPPLDPASQVAKEVGMAEVARKTQADQQNLQLKAQELQAKGQESQQKNQLTLVSSQQKIQADQQKFEAELQAKSQAEMIKAHMSVEIEKMKLEQKASTDLMLAHLENILKVELAELAAKTTLAQEQISAAQQAEADATQQAQIEGGV